MTEIDRRAPRRTSRTPRRAAGETVDVRHGMFGASGSGDTSGYGGLVRPVQLPGASSRPYGGYFDEVADALERAVPTFADAIEKVVVDRGELTFHVAASTCSR